MSTKKSKKRKAQRRQPLPQATGYLADSSAKGELMMMEYGLGCTVAQLETAVAQVAKQLHHLKGQLWGFRDKLQERKAR